MTGVLNVLLAGKATAAASSPVTADFSTGLLPTGVTASGATNGTRFNSSGVMVAATAPRFDYDPLLIQQSFDLPGLLVEEARTNYVFPSVPGAGAWGVVAGDTITTSAGTGPDAAACSSIALRDGRTNAALVYYLTGVLPATTVLNAWVKGTKRQSVFLWLASRANWIIHTFSGEWERTADCLSTTSGACFLGFSTTRDLSGNADAVEGLPAVTFLVSHVDVQEGIFSTSTIRTTVATVTRTRDTISLSGTPLSIMQQATGSMVARVVRKPLQGVQGGIIGGSVLNSWALNDTVAGSPVQSGLFGAANLASAGIGLAQGIVQRVGGSWQAGAHAVCVDGYTVGTSADATALAVSPDYELGSYPGFATVMLNGWLLRYDFYATKLSNAALQSACALPAPVSLGSAAPRGASLLNFTNKIIDISPTTANIAPGYTDAGYAFFDSIWYDSTPPDKTVYSDVTGALVIPYGHHIISQNRSSLHSTLPYLYGYNGFYVEYDVYLSDNNASHFPAVWSLPQEHNAAQSDAYGGGDPAGYERWMELDIDEGGFGPSTTSSVIDWQGNFSGAAYWRDYPTNTIPGNDITNKIALGWIDRTQTHTFGASFDNKTKVVRWYLDNIEIFQSKDGAPSVALAQNYYVIIGAQSHAAVDYDLYLKRVRAYTVPRIIGYGDSLVFGTGASSFPLTTWLYQLATFFSFGQINRGVGGVTSTSIAASVVDLSYEATNADIVIIDGGYNNYTNVAGTVQSDFATAVAALPVGTRYLIMGIPTAEVAALYTGGADRAKLNTINTDLAATYGTRFINIDAALKAQSTHAGQDAVDDGHDIVPVSQRSDAVHWNDAGHATVYATIKAKIQALGWA